MSEYYHDGGGLTSSGVKAVTDHLDGVVCPLCKHCDWEIGDRVANLNARMGMNLPAVVPTCRRCSHMLAFAPPPYAKKPLAGEPMGDSD